MQWGKTGREGSVNDNALHKGLQTSDENNGLVFSTLQSKQRPISDNGGDNSQGISDLQNKEYETVEDYINQNYKEPYYHASPERVITPRNNGKFGSALFFTSSDTNSRGIGNHVIDKADLKTTTSKNIYNDYDYSSDEDVKAFAKSYGIDEDTAFDIITERKNAYKNIDDKYDVSEADWDAQSLLLKIAKKMGYEAVEAEDENGAVLIADVNAASRTMKSTEDIYEYITGEREEDDIRFSVVQDEKLLDELEKGETVKVGDEVDATGFDEYLDERAEAEGITSKEDIKKAKELARIAKKKAIGEKYLEQQRKINKAIEKSRKLKNSSFKEKENKNNIPSKLSKTEYLTNTTQLILQILLKTEVFANTQRIMPFYFAKISICA